jgi:diacylglycerol kinase (ATP)
MIQDQWIQQKNAPFSAKARLKSFVYAWNGIIQFFKREHNAQLHLVSTIVVIVLAVYLKVNSTEAVFLAFATGFVWVTEMINTAIEKAMDFITMERHHQIKLVKDLSAGAVLVASFTSLITGALIFIPKFLML